MVILQVAGIDSDSGALLWRHAQETDQLGAVKALKVKFMKNTLCITFHF